MHHRAWRALLWTRVVWRALGVPTARAAHWADETVRVEAAEAEEAVQAHSGADVILVEGWEARRQEGGDKGFAMTLHSLVVPGHLEPDGNLAMLAGV